MTIIIEPSEVFAVADRYEVAYRLYQDLQASYANPQLTMDVFEMSKIVVAIIDDAAGDSLYLGARDTYKDDVAVLVAVHALMERATSFSRVSEIEPALHYCSVIGDVADESEEEDV